MTNSMVSPRSATLCGFHPQPQGPGARSRCRTAPASRLPPVVRRISTIIASQSCPRHVRSPPGYTPSRTPDTPGRPPAGPARRRPRCRRAAGSSSPEPRCTGTGTAAVSPRRREFITRTPVHGQATISPHRREFITRTPMHGHGHDLATPPGVHHQNPGARHGRGQRPPPPGPHRVRLAAQHQRRHTERAKRQTPVAGRRSPAVRGGARRRLAQVALPSGRDAVVREPRRPTHQVLVDRATRPAGTSPPPGRREDSCAAGRSRPAGAEPPLRRPAKPAAGPMIGRAPMPEKAGARRPCPGGFSYEWGTPHG
jgi:hypothetical protein